MAYYKTVLIIIILFLGVYLVLDNPMNQSKLIEFKENTESFIKNIYPINQSRLHNETFGNDKATNSNTASDTVKSISTVTTASEPIIKPDTIKSNTVKPDTIKPYNVTQTTQTDNIMKDINDDAVCEKESNGKCSRDVCGSDKLHPILDPKFNMRETSKQCLLLEDHLNNSKKRCFDCIRKHFLIIDGLLEEAISLEKDNMQRNHYRELYLEWVKIEKKYAGNPTDSNNMDDVSKMVRVFRKPLVEQYFDTISDYDIS